MDEKTHFRSTNLPRILLLTSLVIALVSLGIPLVVMRRNNGDEIIAWEIDNGPEDLWRFRGGRCDDIPIVDERSLSAEVFFAEYWRQRPVVLRRDPLVNREAQRRSQKDYLLQHHGDATVSLAGTQAFAFRKEERTTLADYLQRMKDNHHMFDSKTIATTTATTNASWDFANVTNFAFGPDMFRMGDVYRVPQVLLLRNADDADDHDHDDIGNEELKWHFQVAYAAPQAGLTFHWHGDVFAETLHGHRRWFLVPPTHSPVFHPRTTSADWFRRTFHGQHQDDAANSNVPLILSCTLEPNHAIYVPADWWHAVVSLGEAVSMTTSFPVPYRRDRYSLDGGHHAYMLDAMERQDFATAIQQAQLWQQRRPRNFIPHMWLGTLYTLAARRQQQTSQLQDYIERGIEATTRCIELNPWFGPCYVWRARQYNSLALLIPHRQVEFMAAAQSATAMASSLGDSEDDELLDPRWQPKNLKQR
eukprot:scaffold1803_cov92-Amphora_coffeaeformis.AAC.63